MEEAEKEIQKMALKVNEAEEGAQGRATELFKQKQKQLTVEFESKEEKLKK